MMRIRLILETLFLFLAALSLSEACGKVREPETVRFEVSPSTLTVDAPGGQVAFSVLSSEDWMASADQSWAKLLTVKGSGSESAVTVKVSVSENTATGQRSATIRVSTLGGKKEKWAELTCQIRPQAKCCFIYSSLQFRPTRIFPVSSYWAVAAYK